MPCPTWTTRSPSRSSRKLSITRVSRRCEGRRRSVRRNNSPLLSSTIRSDTSRKPLCSVPTGKCSRPSRAARVAPNSRASRRTSASVWQTTNILGPLPASSSSSRTRLMSPLKRSTDSIFNRQVVSNEPSPRPTPRPTESEIPAQDIGNGVERRTGRLSLGDPRREECVRLSVTPRSRRGRRG